MPDASAIILLEGGHKSRIDGLGVNELEAIVSDYRQQDDYSLIYLQGTQYGDNGYVLDPSKVVAIVRAPGRDSGSRNL